MSKSNGTRKLSDAERKRRSDLAKQLHAEGRFGGDRSAEGSGRRRLWPDRLRSLLAAAFENQLRDLSYNPERLEAMREFVEGMQTAIRLHPPLERDRLTLLTKALLEECARTNRLPRVCRIAKEEGGKDLVATLLWHPGRRASIRTWGENTFDVDEIIREALPRLTGRELCETILLCSYLRLRVQVAPGEEPFRDELDEAADAILYDEIAANLREAVRAELKLREVASADN